MFQNDGRNFQVHQALFLLRKDIEECLKTVYDLERIVGRISCGNCNAKDLAQLRRSLSNVPNLKSLLLNTSNEKLVELSNNIDSIEELYDIFKNYAK